MSDLVFLRPGGGFESIGFYRIAPSSKKGMAQTRRDTESADFRGLQPMATVCEQSATVSIVGGRLKQFATDCNTHRQGRQLPDSQTSGSGT
jgi:hypothetical protein